MITELILAALLFMDYEFIEIMATAGVPFGTEPWQWFMTAMIAVSVPLIIIYVKKYRKERAERREKRAEEEKKRAEERMSVYLEDMPRAGSAPEPEDVSSDVKDGRE